MNPEQAQARFGRPAALLVDAPYPVVEITVSGGTFSSGRADCSMLIRYADAAGTARISVTTSYTTAAVADGEYLRAVLDDAIANLRIAEADPTQLESALLRSMSRPEVAASYELFDGFVNGDSHETGSERRWLTIRDGQVLARATLHGDAAISYVASDHAGYRPRIRIAIS